PAVPRSPRSAEGREPVRGRGPQPPAYPRRRCPRGRHLPSLGLARGTRGAAHRRHHRGRPRVAGPPRDPGHHPRPAARRRGRRPPRRPAPHHLQPGLPAGAGGLMTTGPTDPGGAPDSAPEVVAEAVTRSRMSQLAGEDFSVADAVGGVRGLVESVAPGLVCGTPVTQALGGVVGVLVGVLWAWRSGEAQDYFALGLWTNAIYGAGLLLSIVVRWPLVGVVVALLRQEGFAWRTDPEQRPRLRRYTAATWLWIGLFGARLAVQLPLYLDASTAWLGTARLVMGVPLWALALWVTWLLVRERPAAAAQPGPPAH